jgi:hypothetical protein
MTPTELALLYSAITTAPASPGASFSSRARTRIKSKKPRVSASVRLTRRVVRTTCRRNMLLHADRFEPSDSDLDMVAAAHHVAFHIGLMRRRAENRPRDR